MTPLSKREYFPCFFFCKIFITFAYFRYRRFCTVAVATKTGIMLLMARVNTSPKPEELTLLMIKESTSLRPRERTFLMEPAVTLLTSAGFTQLTLWDSTSLMNWANINRVTWANTKRTSQVHTSQMIWVSTNRTAWVSSLQTMGERKFLWKLFTTNKLKYKCLLKICLTL